MRKLTCRLEVSVAGVVERAEEGEGQVKHKEEHGKCHTGADAGDEEDGRDTEPDPEVEAHGGLHFTGGKTTHGVDAGYAIVGTRLAKEGNEDEAEAPPEHAVADEDGGTEGVTTGKFPKTSEPLREAA